MQKNSISLKTLLVAVAFTSPFIVNAADAKTELKQINNNIGARIEALEIDVENNVRDNHGPTGLKPEYIRQLRAQLNQLKALKTQADQAANNAVSGRRAARRGASAEQIRLTTDIAYEIAYMVARLDQLGQLTTAVDEETRADALAFLSGLDLSKNQDLNNKVQPAIGILQNR